MRHRRPDEFDVLFESIVDEQFGYDLQSEYNVYIASA